MHERQDRHIEAMGVGTPPPLAIRLVVDEVHRILDQRSGRPSRAIDDRRSRPRLVDARAHTASEAVRPVTTWM